MQVRLNGKFKDPFSRWVRDEKGNPIRRLTFAPATVIEVEDPDDIAAIKDDLGRALIEVEAELVDSRPARPLVSVAGTGVGPKGQDVDEVLADRADEIEAAERLGVPPPPPTATKPAGKPAKAKASTKRPPRP